MSKSRDNAVILRASADETAQLVKKAKTDSNRGCAEANRVGESTLRETRRAMKMDYGL